MGEEGGERGPRYRLSLTVDSDGRVLTFSSETAAPPGRMDSLLGQDIAAAIDATGGRTSAARVAASIEPEDDPLGLVARLEQHWGGACNMDECLSLTVDVDRLCEESEDWEREMVLGMLRRSGWARAGKVTPPGGKP